MKRFFCLLVYFILLFPFHVLAQDAKENYTIEFAPKFENKASVPKGDIGVFDAFDIWKQYVLTEDKSLLVNQSVIQEDLLSAFKTQIFYTYLPKNFFHYQIIDYKRENETYLLTTHLYVLFPKDSSITTLSIFNVRAIPQKDNSFKIRFMFEENMPKLTKKETKWIDYYFLPSLHSFSNGEAKKANTYCDSIAKTFDLRFKSKMQYYIFPSSQDLYTFWGHLAYWIPNVVMIDDKGNKIFMTHASEFYTHEIVHFLFTEYTPSLVFSEGLATWAGGGNYYTSLNEGLKALLLKANLADADVIEQILTYKYRKANQGFYYVGAILMKKAYEVGGKNLVKAILATSKDADSIEVIRQHFGFKTKKEAIEFVITIIKEYQND